MEIILLETIHRLGGLGDTVKVKAGFARNFLVPTGKAVFATKSNLKKFEARRAELERIQAEKVEKAQQRAQALEGTKVIISATVSEEGKLYGSIGTDELAQAITEQCAPIQKSEVTLPDGAMRFIGEYEITLLLETDVQAVVHVEIVPNTTG